eukprot:1141948-Pelagomonas_calceolata.AAC.5
MGPVGMRHDSLAIMGPVRMRHWPCEYKAQQFAIMGPVGMKHWPHIVRALVVATKHTQSIGE